MVLQAGGESSEATRRAFSELCCAYWYPLYAFVRRRGHAPAEAQDLTQEFFARLLEHNWVARADRPDALLLDGGDTWHGSYTCYHTEGQDMVNVMNALKPDAMTFHWEFTLGSDRVHELVEGLPFAALGQNIFDAEWDEPVLVDLIADGVYPLSPGNDQGWTSLSALPLTDSLTLRTSALFGLTAGSPDATFRVFLTQAY